jgi:hypothetical protein
MENNGYKHEPATFINVKAIGLGRIFISKDWRVITFQPLHVYFSFNKQKKFLNTFKFLGVKKNYLPKGNLFLDMFSSFLFSFYLATFFS